jgi:uncharacterized membrane protein
MKLLPEKDYHELFRIGILVKAADGIIEAIVGAFIYFANYTVVNAVLLSAFRDEIAESPRDPTWNYLIGEWHRFLLSSHTFWGLLFVAHGAVKFFLSVALLKKYLWAYPTAAVVFTLFVGYEIFSLTIRPSLFLWLITIFDVIVVGLILHEDKHKRKNRTM